MRGKLASRPHRAVLCEAEKPVENDVRELELLVISQDTSAYGTDWPRADRAGPEQPITRLARDLGSLGAGVRLHDVYPQSDVRKLIPPMAEGGGAALPGHPLPACLDRIAEWRGLCPDITLRVTFIVGYRGEIAAEVQHLLDRLDEAQPDRVGCFRYENVAGVRSNALPDHVPAEVKQDRWDRIMEKARANFGAKLAAKVGRTMEVIVDDIDEDGIATCRTRADAPEIDGNLFIDAGTEGPSVGEIVRVEVDEAGEHDLRGCLASRD
jgi:ribosomal protein S12 methylthiotransferase